MRQRKGKNKICQYIPCQKSFYAFPYQINIRQYCSQTCSNKANAPKLSQDRIGKGNPRFGKRPWNYIDGKSRTQRNDYQYWNWRRQVFLRDKQICQNCFTKLKRKDCIAHHIKPWRNFIKLRYTISNGITYCRKCHNIIDPRIKSSQY